MSVGLTLGKFAPFHRGHQQLLETAIAEMDRVIVLIYEAAETRVPLRKRANWIRHLYPQVEVIEVNDGPTEVSDRPDVTALHDALLRKVVGHRGITHFYSAEFYGDHVSRALDAVDRRLDRGEISGTLIRSDPFKHRRHVDAIVYRDLITKVVFLGAPSTGKTTIAEALARRYDTVWMPEYGREYWEAHQVERRLTPQQLVEIAEGHREREDKLLLDANRLFFVDTDATTTFVFSHYYHGCAEPRLAELAAQARDRYDIAFLCEDDIPYDDTWDRSGAANRARMQAMIRDDLAARGIDVILLTGSVEERMAKACQAIHSRHA
jgi:HTH-type transcriptional repressor of NAD biosynthesis genes